MGRVATGILNLSIRIWTAPARVINSNNSNMHHSLSISNFSDSKATQCWGTSICCKVTFLPSSSRKCSQAIFPIRMVLLTWSIWESMGWEKVWPCLFRIGLAMTMHLSKLISGLYLVNRMTSKMVSGGGQMLKLTTTRWSRTLKWWISLGTTTLICPSMVLRQTTVPRTSIQMVHTSKPRVKKGKNRLVAAMESLKSSIAWFIWWLFVWRSGTLARPSLPRSSPTTCFGAFSSPDRAWLCSTLSSWYA